MPFFINYDSCIVIKEKNYFRPKIFEAIVGNFKYDYLDRTIEFAREPLLNMKMTSNGVVAKMGVAPENATVADLQASVFENWGINMTDEEAETILGYSAKYTDKFLSSPDPTIPLNYALSRILSEGEDMRGIVNQSGQLLSY